MKYSKNGSSLSFAQPSLHNIPLFWQDLHRKYIWNRPVSLTSYWQLMDGSNPISGIQNDKVQKWRGWVTVAEEMNGRGNLHSRRPNLLFLHEEDNEWVDNSRNSFSAINIGLKKIFCAFTFVSSVATMWKVFKTLWNLTVTDGNGCLCQHTITFEGWKCSPRSQVQPAHATDTPPLYSLPNAIEDTSKAVLRFLNVFRFRKG